MKVEQNKMVGVDYKLTVDGQMGPRTVATLKKFQKQNGLEPTGKVDYPTMDKLGMLE